MEKSNHLTRTCASCGLKKPLSAFLQLTVGLGTHYGNICSDCRLKKSKTTTPAIEEEWSTAGASGRIGAKEKAFIDEKKARDLKEKYAAEKKVLGKKTQENLDKNTKDELKSKFEKDHRNFFLETKPTSLIGEKPSIERQATQDFSNNAPESSQEIKAVYDFLAREQKFRAGEIGHVPLSLNEMKYNTARFGEFISFLTDASPLKRFLNQHSQKPSAFASKPTAHHETKSARNHVEEFIERKLGPSSKM